MLRWRRPPPRPPRRARRSATAHPSRSRKPARSSSASSPDKAPFGYIDADGKPAGYDVVYGDRIAADLGVTAKYVPVDAAARTEVLASNKVDITLANFTVTPERAEKVDFANPYFKVSLGVVSPTSAESPT